MAVVELTLFGVAIIRHVFALGLAAIDIVARVEAIGVTLTDVVTREVVRDGVSRAAADSGEPQSKAQRPKRILSWAWALQPSCQRARPR
jgi:hypothetical protein